jgi:hypothetical protein
MTRNQSEESAISQWGRAQGTGKVQVPTGSERTRNPTAAAADRPRDTPNPSRGSDQTGLAHISLSL